MPRPYLRSGKFSQDAREKRRLERAEKKTKKEASRARYLASHRKSTEKTLAKGSQEALEWGKKMRELRLNKKRQTNKQTPVSTSDQTNIKEETQEDSN